MRDPLRVLSLWQPHGTLCVAIDPTLPEPAAPKLYETRHWTPRGIEAPFDVVVHATKTWTRDVRDTLGLPRFRDALLRCGYSNAAAHLVRHGEAFPATTPRPLPLGALVGVVTVLGWQPTNVVVVAQHRAADADRESPAMLQRALDVLAFGDFAPGRFAWTLGNPRAFPEPIPFMGRQDVLYPLGAHMQARVDEQLAAVVA